MIFLAETGFFDAFIRKNITAIPMNNAKTEESKIPNCTILFSFVGFIYYIFFSPDNLILSIKSFIKKNSRILLNFSIYFYQSSRKDGYIFDIICLILFFEKNRQIENNKKGRSKVERLSLEIEKKREQLIAISHHSSLTSQLVLQYSTELDSLIHQYNIKAITKLQQQPAN